MRRKYILALFFFSILLLTACEVPTPPPELPTATPGSQNPESPLSQLGLTQVVPTPLPGFTPLPVGPGHIYFVRDTGLWRISPDGSGETKLSDLPVSNVPQPSPDGSMITFTSGKDLYMIPSSGGTARKLASGDLTEDQRLGWSSDGSLVGYMTYDMSTPGKEQAWYVPVQGGQPSLITDMTQSTSGNGPSYERSVQWSPDGRWVLVGGVNNPVKLLSWPLSQAGTSGTREIIGGEPDWSPDSRTILYSQTLDGALAIYYIIESGATPFRDEQQLVGTGMGEYAQGPSPRWSPASNGSSEDLIAYRSRNTNDEPRVSIRQRNNIELNPLPNLTNSPAWSPTGDHLVVETGDVQNDPLGIKWVPDGLAIAKINFKGDHTLTPLVKDGRSPSWGK